MGFQFASWISVAAFALSSVVTLTAKVSPAVSADPSTAFRYGILQPVSNSFAKLPVQPALPVSEIARQVTVRILSNRGSGSGVIITQKGQTYTVLTAKHVVAFNEDNRFTVLTSDGMTHTAQWQTSVQFEDTDLALVNFRSDRAYQVVEIGDSNALAVGDLLYASGFPNWHRIERNRSQNTRSWGLRAFRLTEGRVGMLPARSMLKGYQLGYTNQIEAGMSGGPVLDRDGQLVGINGRSKYPPRGIRAFAFADGTLPSRELFRQMEVLSWGIPIATFHQISRQMSRSV